MKHGHEHGQMPFVEFIGLVITVVTIFFMFLKRIYDDLKKRSNPEGYEEEQLQKEQVIKDMLRGQPKEAPRHLPPVPKKMLPKVKTAEKITSVTYENKMKDETSRGKALIGKLSSRKDLFILNEIIKPPVTLRSNEEHIW